MFLDFVLAILPAAGARRESLDWIRAVLLLTASWSLNATFRKGLEWWRPNGIPW